MRDSLKTPAWKIVRIGVLSYVGLVVVMMIFENWFVYRPSSAADYWQAPPVPAKQCEDVAIALPDGGEIHGWWLPLGEPAEQTVLILHGNGGNLSMRGFALQQFRDRLQANVLIIDYPGYGQSAGSPSETACYQSAHAARDWLVHTKNIPDAQIIYHGESLGGGVALELAAAHTPRLLILEKTFTSLPDVGQLQFPWLPVRWIMRNRFDNRSRIALCKAPIFIAHGDADQLVPFAHGEALFALAAEPKRFMRLEGLGHNDPLPPTFFAEVKDFLQATR